MKLKTLLCTVVAMSAAYASQAQIEAKVGPEVGFGIGSMITSDKYTDNVYGGVFAQFGGTGDIQFGRWFALRPSVMFNFSTLSDGSDPDLDQVVNTNNLYIPVDALATFRFGNGSKLFIGAGPYLSYTFSGKFKHPVANANGYYERKTEDLKLGTGTDKQLQPLDLGVNCKLGFQFRNNLFMNFSFNIGAKNRAPYTDDGYKIKSQQLFAFGIGYLFGPQAETSRAHGHSRSRR